MPRKWREQGCEENRKYDGRTEPKEILKEWEENEEQQQKMKGIGGY